MVGRLEGTGMNISGGGDKCVSASCWEILSLVVVVVWTFSVWWIVAAAAAVDSSSLTMDDIFAYCAVKLRCVGGDCSILFCLCEESFFVSF